MTFSTSIEEVKSDWRKPVKLNYFGVVSLSLSLLYVFANALSAILPSYYVKQDRLT